MASPALRRLVSQLSRPALVAAASDSTAAAASRASASASSSPAAAAILGVHERQQQQRAGFSSQGAPSVNDYTLGNGPSSMRGVVFWETGKPMTVEDLQMPRPRVGEVLVKTKACGVCHSDLHVIKGDQPYPHPCVLGHEITGEVVEHAETTDPATKKRLPVGSRVVGSFIMPCGGCFFCIRGQEDICETFFKNNRSLGGLLDGETRLFLKSSGKPVYMYSMGGLAEYCVVPSNALAVLPPSLPYAECSILGCAIFTAYGAIRNGADLRAGDTVAIIGTGGVGSGCLQIAKAFGARQIIAVDISDKKLANAKKMGATHGINGTKENVVDRIKEITGGRGVDAAVEALGMASTFTQAVQGIRDGGKAVMVGLAKAGATVEVDMAKLVRREVKIVGSYGGKARSDLPTVISLAEMGLLDIKSSVTETCSLEEADGAYAAMARGDILGRAVVDLEAQMVKA